MINESAINPESSLVRTKDTDFSKKNVSNYRLLIDNWDARKGISFLGAGTSSPLGIKDWRVLIKTLQDEVKIRYGIDVDIDKDDLPPVADRLFNEFETRGHGSEFDSIIFRHMDPKCNSATLTTVKLALLLDTHITTNFDISIGNAYTFLNYMKSLFQKSETQDKEMYSYSIPDLPNYYKISKINGAHIIYLHGKKNEPYVFKKRDYDKFYPSVTGHDYSKSIEDCLKSFLKEASFLFVGFSFDDIRLKQMIFRVIAEIKRDILINDKFLGPKSNTNINAMPKHYLLVKNNEKMSRDTFVYDFYREFEQYNIYPIIYEEHIFVEKLTDFLLMRGHNGLL